MNNKYYIVEYILEHIETINPNPNLNKKKYFTFDVIFRLI